MPPDRYDRLMRLALVSLSRARPYEVPRGANKDAERLKELLRADDARMAAAGQDPRCLIKYESINLKKLQGECGRRGVELAGGESQSDVIALLLKQDEGFRSKYIGLKLEALLAACKERMLPVAAHEAVAVSAGERSDAQRRPRRQRRQLGWLFW